MRHFYKFIRILKSRSNSIISNILTNFIEKRYKITTDGAFYENISKNIPSLSLGNHTVTIYAKDIHGLNGTPTVINFNVPGKVPSFVKISVYKGSKEDTTVDYVPGIELNPESGAER